MVCQEYHKTGADAWSKAGFLMSRNPGFQNSPCTSTWGAVLRSWTCWGIWIRLSGSNLRRPCGRCLKTSLWFQPTSGLQCGWGQPKPHSAGEIQWTPKTIRLVQEYGCGSILEVGRHHLWLALRSCSSHGNETYLSRLWCPSCLGKHVHRHCLPQLIAV